MTKEFKVGDVLVVKNCFNTYKHTITRVTKTQAICDVKRSDGTGYTARYRKVYEDYENGKFHVDPIPYNMWNMNEYTVVPKDE